MRFSEELALRLPPGFTLPVELAMLLDWLEELGHVFERGEERIASLVPPGDLAGWSEEGRAGGTFAEFHSSPWMVPYECFMDDEVEDESADYRVCAFARTGGDGSGAAFWIDARGDQQIVHIGSGSGSLMNCILANSALDFLRLLAIGYDEICWIEQLNKPPNASPDYTISPHVAYQRWLTETFGAEIPERGTDVIPHPSEWGDRDSLDEFCRWGWERNAT